MCSLQMPDPSMIWRLVKLLTVIYMPESQSKLKTVSTISQCRPYTFIKYVYTLAGFRFGSPRPSCSAPRCSCFATSGRSVMA